MLKVEDDFCQVARQNPSGLDAIKEASIKSYIATGPRAGQEVRRLRSLGHDGERAVLKSSRCVSINGFSIHADTMVKKHRGQDLEKLLRYMARPPLSLDRLSLDDDGNVVWRLRNIFSDGTDALLFSPMELLEKISSIIPPPWLNLTRYFGCFAPNSEIRPLIVPKPKTAPLTEESRTYWIKWAELLKRVFKIDILCCDDCQGRLELVSVHFIKQRRPEPPAGDCESQAPPGSNEIAYEFDGEFFDIP
jgi:hypothetical protein